MLYRWRLVEPCIPRLPWHCPRASTIQQALNVFTFWWYIFIINLLSNRMNVMIMHIEAVIFYMRAAAAIAIIFPPWHDQAIDSNSWLNRALSFGSEHWKRHAVCLPACVSWTNFWAWARHLLAQRTRMGKSCSVVNLYGGSWWCDILSLRRGCLILATLVSIICVWCEYTGTISTMVTKLTWPDLTWPTCGTLSRSEHNWGTASLPIQIKIRCPFSTR